MDSSVTGVQQEGGSQRAWLPVFQFRNVFWVNLQHFLYLQARLERGLPVISGGQPPSALAAADLSQLTPTERQEWQNAVGYYGAHFANYDLSYDSFLVRVDDRLGEMGKCPDITGQSDSACDAGIDPDLTKVLEEAAPVYRAHWWLGQQRTNDAWIVLASKLIRQYGGKPAAMLASVFDTTWPPDPIPIDVTVYAGAYGAYTTLDPLHVSVSSVDPRNQGSEALEIVFRESSHALAEPVEQAIVEQCRKLTKPTPRDLWHALAFYTTARVFERVFGNELIAGSAPGSASPSFLASERDYVSERRWQHYEVLLEVYWQPYLNNKIDMASAIEDLVAAL
ncbi:MAG: hypothetical protein KGL59_06600 [Acidobacteriota bacterium]|nr:hypothetical protein [Acidobacteriota bacterium]